MAWLRERGAGTAWTHVYADDDAAHAFWRSRGFVGDTVRFALY